jgi:2-oxoglutarate ferredoxin oxidoreductase subunit alpha
MTDARAAKIDNIAGDIPPQAVESGAESGRLAVVGWGSTYGPIARAVHNLQAEGVDVTHIHLRHLWPFPANLGDLLGGFEQILVPEMNNGQLVNILRAAYLVPAEGLNQINGKPFKIATIEAAIRERLES